MKSKAHLRQSSGNTCPRPGILDQPADLDLIFSTLIINDSPIHQQRSGQPSKDSINTDAINSDLARPVPKSIIRQIECFSATFSIIEN
ncbi:hypothetical protein PSHT_04060 [Puccinia striiformis]|uniref:Uncharacterized protein n=1 Tax=Puccinia striiformis TaxID=27350 RepID=A0A2S4WDQ0_9BASI|nr:hypothetical protein PSHT_04060 [Puccinia striiformis]